MRPFSLALCLALTAAAGPALAQIAIDHSAALAGGVTPGDSAGYPVTITQPGHYVLTSNLTVPLGMGGIVVDAPNVTLDLNGFALGSSSGTCTQDLQTQAVSCNHMPIVDGTTQSRSGVWIRKAGVVVRNGAVHGFRGHGLTVSGGPASFEHLRVHGNQYHGIVANTGPVHSRVSQSMLLLNGASGIFGQGVLVERSTSSNNGGHGVHVAYGAVTDSLLARNAGHGVMGNASGPKLGVRGTHFIANTLGSLGAGTASAGGNFNGVASF